MSNIYPYLLIELFPPRLILLDVLECLFDDVFVGGEVLLEGITIEEVLEGEAHVLLELDDEGVFGSI